MATTQLIKTPTAIGTISFKEINGKRYVAKVLRSDLPRFRIKPTESGWTATAVRGIGAATKTVGKPIEGRTAQAVFKSAVQKFWH